MNLIEDLEKEKDSEELKDEDPIPDDLTPDQELIILKEWNKRETNPPSLKELVQLVFGGQYDGRDKRAQLVKKFLATKKLKAPVSYQYQAKGLLNLTEEQKEFISNNIRAMTCLEMAEQLFNKKLTNLSQETRSVISFARTLNDRVKYADPKAIATEIYKSPRIESSMIARINKYVDNPVDEKHYSSNDKQKRWVKALIGYVNSYRFVQQINTYDKVEDRELFESSFISYVYGKDDLTPEERDQYIILCSEVVISKNILERIEKFQKEADECLDSDEGKRLSMTLVDAISGLRTEYNGCVKRQRDLMDDLKGKRSKRIAERVRENESLVSLVEFWRNEEKRKRLVAAAELHRAKLKDEVAKLESMDALKCEIFGITAEEILYS